MDEAPGQPQVPVDSEQVRVGVLDLLPCPLLEMLHVR